MFVLALSAHEKLKLILLLCNTVIIILTYTVELNCIHVDIGKIIAFNESFSYIKRRRNIPLYFNVIFDASRCIFNESKMTR